jgi:hypothetical protein
MAEDRLLMKQEIAIIEETAAVFLPVVKIEETSETDFPTLSVKEEADVQESPIEPGVTTDSR